MIKNVIRRILFGVTMLISWCFSVGYSRELFKLGIENHYFKSPGNVNIDGADFSALADLAVSGVNGLVVFLVVGFYVFFETLFMGILVFIFKLITLRKTDVIEQSELAITRRLIIISSILSLLSGILVTNVHLVGYVIALSWQQPFFLFLIYYLALKNRVNHLENENNHKNMTIKDDNKR